MSAHYLYLAVDLFTILVPFLFSFYPKANFSYKWKYLWPGLVLTGTFFLIWDDWFTKIGVWGFNPEYIVGVYFFNLPLEEVLFFICIPYACVFTYEALGYLVKHNYFKSVASGISLVLMIGLAIIGILNFDKLYTAVTFLFCSAFLLYVHIKLKPEYLGRFYFSYLILLVPFSIVNGILTGTGIEKPVVWYNNEENLGLRLGTIPVEDIFYGMLLILMNVVIFESLQKKRPKQASF